MAEYKVVRVSDQAPREHFNEKFNSTTYYIKVMLEGHDRPVTIGKKSPDALKVGDTVNGTILPTEYDADNFKSEPKAFTPGQTFQKRDDSAIRAQWAIGQAVNEALAMDSTVSVDSIESRAQQFYAMVDRVKNSSPAPNSAPKQSGYDIAKAQAEKLRGQSKPLKKETTFSDGSPVQDVWPGNEEINLDDIPF